MSQDKDKIQNNDNSITKNIVPNVENNSQVNENKPPEIIPIIRENMVLKATDFLIHGPVHNFNIDRKVNFLRSKGLTDQEIQLSFQRAAACNNGNTQNNSLSTPVNSNVSNTSNTVELPSMSQFFGPIVIAATIVYFGNHIYKKYVEKWLFGVFKSPIEKRLEAVELSMQKCIVLLEEKNSTSEISKSHIDRQKELDQIRAELKSIKSLLLNRFQFPPAPASSSIPQWQLTKNSKPQGEQQNKINSTDTLKSPQNGIINGTKNLVFESHANGKVDSDIVKGNNNSVPNEITSLLTNNSNDVIIQTNGDKHDDNINE